MTTHTDDNRIKLDVGEYYRYGMFSHKWENNESLFEMVTRTAVYGLEESPTHHKLRMFCKIVQDAGLHWAWSDTCCINKADHFVLQEALVSMFKWYEGSTVTVVFLHDVPSLSLMDSIWNKRAWTFQEYHASKVVRFYTKYWTLYRNIDVPNHKESPEIISEMENAMGVSARALKALRPGLESIREKLCLASTRESYYVEDAAYSLLGIFAVTLPVVYGEGNKSLGQLLAKLLTSSGDTGILAWTGKSGEFNSCLPAHINVFNQLQSPHIPTSISTAKMRTSSLDTTLATKLYDRLHELPVASFQEKRMKLPCLTFKVSVTQTESGYVSAETDALGTVKITTTEDISRLDSMILVHPWIDHLLDRRPVGDISTGLSHVPFNIAPVISPTPRMGWNLRRAFSRPISPPSPAPSFQSHSPLDKLTPALEDFARLKQPFGAMLFAPVRRNVAEYRRVAADSMITVQVQEDVPLSMLIENTRMLDVL